MKRGWIVAGWLVALAASAIPGIWLAADLVERNPLGQYVNEVTGELSPRVYLLVFRWWLPVAIPVSLLALACMFLNRPRD